ncbi:MAG: FixH family protein [Desulfomicrobium escambiense]|nr:FixH family protein [Desulfomicrobium escambiense]
MLADGTMPEHGHGLPTKPRMTQELGSGVYLIEGMKFNMPGWWMVTFTVIAGGQRDSATFNIDLK